MSHYKTQLHDISKIDKNIRIAFIKAEFNLEYTKRIEKENTDFFIQNGFENILSYTVPGAFEIPWFAKKVIDTVQPDIIVAIGVVIRGDTPHFDYVCDSVTQGITTLNITQNTPIIFGILTCNTEEQVQSRIGPNFAIAGLNLLAEHIKISQ
jgi:6,7-dimethyl-8-ribityllumazine synthase